MRDDILDLTALDDVLLELRRGADALLDDEMLRPSTRRGPFPAWPPPRPVGAKKPTPPSPRRDRYYQRVNRGLEGSPIGPRWGR